MSLKIKKYIFRVLLAAIIVGAAALCLHILVNHPGFQQYLIQRLASGSSYDLNTGPVQVTFDNGLGVVARDVVATAKQGNHSLQAAEISVKFKFKQLFQGRFIPERITANNTIWEVNPSKKTKQPLSPKRISDQLPRFEPLFSKVQEMTLENSTVILKNSEYGLKNLDVVMRPSGKDNRQRKVHIKGILTTPESPVPFQIDGSVSPSSTAADNPTISLSLQLTDLPLAQIRWPKQIRFFGGLATGDIRVAGLKDNRLVVSGFLVGKGLDFTVNRKGRSKSYALAKATVDFNGHLGLTEGAIDKLVVKTPETEVGLEMTLDWRSPTNPSLDLAISSQPVTLAVFKKIFPTPLVPAWIEPRLFPIFNEGSARLDRLRLNGTIDRIKKLKLPGNADVFFMQLTLMNMNAFPEDPELTIHEVNGEVTIDRGRLGINGVNARYKASRLDRGTLIWPDLYDKSRRYTIQIQGDFLLENLKRQGSQKIWPPVIRREINRIQSASGPATADIKLSFSGKKQLPILTGTVKCNQSRIHHTALADPLLIKKGLFKFDSAGKTELKTTGSWGSTDFTISGTTGPLWRANGPVRRPTLDLAVVGDMGLSDLFIIREMAMVPAAWRTPLIGIESIGGRLTADITIHRKKENNPGRISGRLSTTGAALTHKSLNLPLSIVKGEVTILPDNTSSFNGSGTWGRSYFSGKGRTNIKKKTMTADLSVTVDINELIRRFAPSHQPQINLTNPATASLQIQQQNARWTLKGGARLDSQIITFPWGFLAPPGNGNQLDFDLTYFSGKWVVETCQFTNRSSLLTFQAGKIESSEGVNNLNMIVEPLDLESIGLHVNNDDGTPHEVKGRLEGRIAVSSPSDISQLNVNGSLLLDGLFFGRATGSRPYRADLRFSGRDLEIVEATFPFGQETGHLSGRLTGWDQWMGTLTLELACIDLSRVIDRMQLSPPGKRPWLTRLLTNANINIGIEANQVIWETIDLGTLAASLHYQKNYLRIVNALFDGPSGMIKLAGSLPGSKRKNVSLMTYFKLSQMPIDAMMEALHRPGDTIDGTLGLEGGLAIRGSDTSEIINNLAGKINLMLTDGSFKKSNIIIKILDFLSIQNIFLRRPPDILKSQFYFKSITGHLTIENGRMTTDKLYMDSPVFNAAIRGSYHLPKNQLNFLVGVQPLNTIDRIISKVPIIGHILTGKKKTILVYYFKIRGKPNEVIVKHIPFKNLDGAIVGYFKRLFLTPTRLLTKISNTLEGIAEDIRTGKSIPEQLDPSTSGP